MTKTNRRATNRKSQIFRLICFTRTRASRGRDLRADSSLHITRRSDGPSPSCFLPLIIFFLVYFLLGYTIHVHYIMGPPPAWALGRRPLAIPPGPALDTSRHFDGVSRDFLLGSGQANMYLRARTLPTPIRWLRRWFRERVLQNMSCRFVNPWCEETV